MAVARDRPGPSGAVRGQLRDNRAQSHGGAISATVELPDGRPARLDLVDIAGRRLERHEFDFALQARGSVRLNAAGALPSGIHWLRLSQGDVGHAHTVSVDPRTHLAYFPLQDVEGHPLLRIMTARLP